MELPVQSPPPQPPQHQRETDEEVEREETYVEVGEQPPKLGWKDPIQEQASADHDDHEVRMK